MDTLKSHWIALKRRNNKVVTLFKSDKTTLEIGVVFKEYHNGNNSIDDKIIFCDVGLLKQGDIIEYNQIKYIIIQQQQTINNIYAQFIGRRLDNNIKIYIDDVLYKISTYIETSQNGIEDGKYMITGKGNLKLTIQDNSITSKIVEDMRMLKWGYGWKVIAKTQENKGLRYIYLEKCGYNSATDNLDLEIADYWEHNIKHSYSMEIDTTDININEKDIKQLSVVIKDTYKENGESKTTVVENPTIIYTSKNSSITTVGKNGLVTGINEGSTTITVQFKDIIKEINIIVNKKIEKPKLIITNKYGNDFIKWDRTNTYTATNNVGKCTWTIVNEKQGDTKEYCIITNTTDNTCTIKANSNYEIGYIILNCVDSKENKGNFRIYIKSIW